MKKDIHPKDYRKVLFLDNSSDSQFVISSTVVTSEKARLKGSAVDSKEYPVYRVEISSASHPFYTGTDKILDAAGRVEKFKAKQAKAKTTVKKVSKVAKTEEKEKEEVMEEKNEQEEIM